LRSPADGGQTETSSAAEGAVDKLRIERRNQFCVAIPFPALEWRAGEGTKTCEQAEKNLAILYDYAVQLANSALDWYLEKKDGKKRRAQLLHNLVYIVGLFAVIVPLAMLGTGILELDGLARAKSYAAEVALGLLALIGGLTFWDKSAGFSADWMRYIITAGRLNKKLVEFQFDWSATNMASKPKLDGTAESGEKKLDPVTERADKLKTFCLTILDIMSAETEGWAIELKERVAQMSRDLPQSRR